MEDRPRMCHLELVLRTAYAGAFYSSCGFNKGSINFSQWAHVSHISGQQDRLIYATYFVNAYNHDYAEYMMGGWGGEPNRYKNIPHGYRMRNRKRYGPFYQSRISR